MEANTISDELYDRIVSLIPSESLKNQIRLTGHRLSDVDLLCTAFRYAPDYDTRIELLQMLEQRYTGELRAYTSRLIHTQRQMLESFIRQEDNAVFELHIKDTPDAYDERYLCRSFDAAQRTIPQFHKEYRFARENGLSRYTIKKRRVLSGDGDFSEDELGELVLLPGNRVYSVDMWSYDEPVSCEVECGDCDLPCEKNRQVVFPQFIRHGEAVRYRDYNGNDSYGIAFDPLDRNCSEYYVIPLNSLSVRYHDFDDILGGHQHIPAPLAERIDEETLPEKMKEDYRAGSQYILERWPGKK